MLRLCLTEARDAESTVCVTVCFARYESAALGGAALGGERCSCTRGGRPSKRFKGKTFKVILGSYTCPQVSNHLSQASWLTSEWPISGQGLRSTAPLVALPRKTTDLTPRRSKSPYSRRTCQLSTINYPMRLPLYRSRDLSFHALKHTIVPWYHAT
jgi:hypothetical protein